MAVEGGYGGASQFQAMAATAALASSQITRLAGSMSGLQGSMAFLSGSAIAFGSLQQNIQLTASVSNGSAQEIKQMSDAVRNFALATKYSASESASALYFLASAGFSTQQSLQAMNGVMLLAQATLSDVGTTADVVAGTISAFGLEAKDAMRVSNLFAASIAQSQGTMEKLGYAMRQVAPVAAAMGVSIEDTTGALSELFNIGLRGQQAGTALRNTMLRLLNPTAQAREILNDMGVATETTTGRVRRLADVLADLANKRISNDTLKTLVDSQAVAGVQGLIRASDTNLFKQRLDSDKEYRDRAQDIATRAGKNLGDVRSELDLMTISITNTQSASKIAMEQVTTLAGSFAIARNGITEFALTAGEAMAPTLTNLANKVTGLAVAFRGMNTNQKESLVSIAEWTAAAMAANRILGGIGSGIAGRGAAGMFNGSSFLSRGMFNIGGNISNVAEMFGGGRGRDSLLERMNPAEFARRNGFYAEASDNNQYRLNRQFRRGRFNYEFAEGPDRGMPVGQSMVERRYRRYDAASNSYRDLEGSAATAGGRALSGIGSFVALAGNLALIGLVVAEVAPLVFDYFKNRGNVDSLIPKVDLAATYKQRSQSILMMGGNPTDQVSAIDEQLKSLQEYHDLVPKQVEAEQTRLSTNADKIRGTITTAASGKFGPDEINSFMSGLASNGNLADYVQSLNAGDNPSTTNMMGSEAVGALLPGSEVGQWIESDKDLRAKIIEYAKNVLQARETIKTATENQKGFKEAWDNLQNTRATLTNTDKYKSEEDMKKIIVEAEGGQYTYISKQLMIELEKDQRNAQTMLAQARAKIKTDPISDFMLTIDTERTKLADSMNNRMEQRKATFLKTFKDVNLNDFGITADQLLGGDYAPTKKEGDHFVGNGPMKQGWRTMLENGSDPAATMKELTEATDDFIAKIKGRNNPEELKAVQRIADANKAMAENYIATLQAETQKAWLDAIKKADENKKFVAGINSKMKDLQKEWLKNVISDTQGITPDFETYGQKRQAGDDYMKQLHGLDTARDQYMEKFDPTRSNPQVQASWNTWAEKFKTQLKVNYDNNISNIIQTSNDARKKALEDLKAGLADVNAQNDQIGTQLYIYSGGNMDYAKYVRGAEASQSKADYAKAIAQINQKIRELQTGVSSATEGKDALAAKPDEAARLALPPLDPHTSNFQDKSLEYLNIIANKAGGADAANAPRTGATAFGLGGATWNNPGNLKAFPWTMGQPGVTGTATAGSNTFATFATPQLGYLAMNKLLQTQYIDKGLTSPAQIISKYAPSSENNTPEYIANLSKALGVDANKPLGNDAATRAKLLYEMTKIEQGHAGPMSAAQIQEVIAGNLTGTPSYATPEQRAMVAKNSKPDINIGQNVDLANGQISGLQKQLELQKQLLEAKQKYADTKGEQDYMQWNADNQALNMYIQSVERTGSALDGVKAAGQKLRLGLQTDFQIGMTAFTSFAEGSADLLAGLITGTTKNWKQALAQMLQGIAQAILKALILRAITAAFGFSDGGVPGGFDGSYGPQLPSFKGNAFAGGRVQRFDTGGVANSMQYFPMAGGMVGSIAELGSPEAILPLQRGRGGKLGVAVNINKSGGTTPINPNMNGGGGSGTINHESHFHFHGGEKDSGQQGSNAQDGNRLAKMHKDLNNEVERTVMKVWAKHSRPGGVMNQATRNRMVNKS